MKNVVFTFGRMNPPHAGHQRLVTKMVETAKSLNADHVLYLSQTQNNTTDPLDWNLKRRICESAFRGINISNDTTLKTPYMALESLCRQYNHITLVVGSDRIDQFKTMPAYAEKWGSDFDIVSAGERIAESEGIEGITASKQRYYAVNGMKRKFMEGLPSTLSESIGELMYRKIRFALK